MKIHNFCAGPSILPSEVFDEASNAVKDPTNKRILDQPIKPSKILKAIL